MATYLSHCEGDEDRALDLYLRNIQLSSAAYASLHMFEVLLRNAIDRELRRWNLGKHGDSDWALNPAPLLRGLIGSDRLADAARDARKAVGKKRDLAHDDVVAQFSLGTWRYVLPSTANIAKQMIWDEALCDVFPRQFEVPTSQIVRWVSIVYDFRNRVAHHEPVFKLDLRGKRQAMRNVLHAIDVESRKWFLANDTMGDEIQKFETEWPQFKKEN